MSDQENKPQPPKPRDISESSDFNKRHDKADYVVDTLKPPPRPQDRKDNNEPKPR